MENYGMKVTSTHEMIEKLQKYEKENGVGAIIGISIVGGSDISYIIEIANDSNANKIFAKDGKYKETKIEISSTLDSDIFSRKY